MEGTCNVFSTIQILSENTVVTDSPFGYLLKKMSGTKNNRGSEQFGLHSNEFSDSYKSPSIAVKSTELSCATHVARKGRKVMRKGFWCKSVHTLPTYTQCLSDTLKYYNKKATKEDTNYAKTMTLFVMK
jgi:hypothetical protein